MPLPTNTALTLSVARPTDTTSSGLKHAMLVRMSTETLDALEAFPGQPTLDFDFGDRSGIYIGESFFPMRHTPQDALHELYLRTSQNNKKTPLKLHANIVGKINIERELQDDLREKIRGTSNDAQNQKASRTTILLDNADIPPPPIHKKPLPPKMFHKPTVNRNSKSSSSTMSTSHKKDIPASSVDTRPRIRKQLVHYLAAGDKTDEQLNTLFEKESTETKREMRLILGQISESTAVGQSGSRYTLKHPIWKEVRPYEYPLPDDERNAMVRSARKLFHNLGIPESDPIWNHVRQRSPPATTSNNTASSSAHSASQDDKSKVNKADTVQRTTVAPARVKPLATKPITKSEIPSKDESNKSLSAKPAPALDPRQSTSHDSRRAPSDSTTDRPTMHSKSSSISKTKPSAPAYPSKSSASTSSKASTNRPGEQSPPPRKPKGSGRDSPAYFDERDRVRVSNSDRKMREASPADRYLKEAKSVSKRKIPVSESDHGEDRHRSPDPKRRKVDDSSYPSSSRRDPPRKSDVLSQSQASYRDRDDTPVRGGDRAGMAQKLPKRLKEPKRSDSPLANDSSSSKLSKGKTMSSNKARQAPVFTSSDEDEEDSRPLKRAVKREPSPAPKRPIKREREPSPPPKRSIKREPSPSPHPDEYTSQPAPPSSLNSDHASLRARYEISYGEYLECFQKLVAEKRKLNRLLKNEDSRSIGSVTDSDLDLMDPDELSRLTNTHRKLHRELENIHNVFTGKA